MKKALFLVAVATLALLSCQKENVKNDVKKNITLTASIEELATKANMNASNQLVWAKGDQIGIYVNEWAAQSNQSFTLKGDGGTTTGSFGRTSEDWFETEQAQVAFFPWNSASATTVNSTTDNNVYGGNVYFKQPGYYDSYTSGKMLTPLVAPVVWNGSAYDPISFKHAGAAVKVTINNLPAGSHSFGMKVDGAQIYGDFHIAPTAASAMELDGTADVSKNEIWLNFDPANAERAFTFIFPVPALTKPKLIFKIYDKNDILVWQKNLKAQSSDIDRGDVLAMPAVSITPYSQFKDVSAWKLYVSLDGDDSHWQTVEMLTDGTLSIATGLTFTAAGKYKFYKGAWAEEYPSGYGANLTISAAGTYDIIFANDTATHDIREVTSGECPYPAVQQNGGSASGFTANPDFDNSLWTL